MDMALLDYGTGNLHSLAKALEAGGARARIEADLPTALTADALVLPGVGSYSAAAAQLAGGAAALRGALAAGMPCLGICLGMQLLFQASEEGEGAGIGMLHGRVRRLHAARVPHMGWNDVEAAFPDPLFEGVESPLVYYANSFVVEPDSPKEVVAWTSYAGDRFPAAVRAGATWGVQFHPEKSGASGLRILANFIRQMSR
jgi:imidazole glycerol-phosphate synthase subunit HisH